MKRKIVFLRNAALIASAVLLALSSCGKGTNITIEGDVPAEVTGKVYLQKFDNKLFVDVDSVEIIDGTFTFNEKLQLPELYGLTFDKGNTPYYIFLEEGKVKVHLDPERGYANSTTTGSTLQDEYTAYQQLEEELNIEQYLKDHPNSLVANYIFYRNYAYRLTPEQIREYITLLNPELQNSPYSNILKDFANTLENVAIGKQAPDFSIEDVNGRQVKLYDYLGNGYVLIDFWAAWCPPCRRENPNVVNAYQRFHEKGFDIVGVSLDQTREAWEKAIADDGLTWNHVSDLKYWGSAPAALYGVRAIPANFLLDASGKIVGRNLRGEALHQKLEELLGS